MQSLINQILAADRLESIAEARREMELYAADHPEDVSDVGNPIWVAAGAMKRTENSLRAMEEDGVNLEEFYKERDEKLQQLLSTP